MDVGLAGKHILVTGGTRGIGRATVEKLLAEGARVSAVARTADSIAKAAESMGDPSNLRFVAADLSDESGCASAASAALDGFGALDGVVNNASAFSIDRGHPGRAEWSELFQLKLLGYESVIQAALPHISAGGGIVNVSGIASMRHWPQSPHVSAVNSGVESLTRHYAAELVERRIRVNVVVPGATATDRYLGRVSRVQERDGVDAEEARRQIDRTVPLGRPVHPEEIAAAIVFLLGDVSASTTGAVLVVDGGAVVSRSAD